MSGVYKGQKPEKLNFAANSTVSASFTPEQGYYPVAISFPSGTVTSAFTIEYDVTGGSSSPDWQTVQWQEVDYAVTGTAGKFVVLEQAATQALIYGYPLRLVSSNTQTSSVDVTVYFALATA